MKPKDDISDRNGVPVEIKPVAFRPGLGHKRSKPSRLLKWMLGIALGTFLLSLCASAWFVFTARQVVIQIDPEPDRFSIRGGILTPKIGDYFLMRSGPVPDQFV